jgi:hypothetical protein
LSQQDKGTGPSLLLFFEDEEWKNIPVVKTTLTEAAAPVRTFKVVILASDGLIDLDRLVWVAPETHATDSTIFHARAQTRRPSAGLAAVRRRRRRWRLATGGSCLSINSRHLGIKKTVWETLKEGLHETLLKRKKTKIDDAVFRFRTNEAEHSTTVF